MAETIAAQVFATVPACDDDDVVSDAFAFQHAQDDYSGAGFAVVVLDLAVIGDQTPRIVGGLGEFLLAAKLLDEGLRLSL